MAGNDITYRFTEEKYGTKADVIHEMNIPQGKSDIIWSSILTYRKTFARTFDIATLAKDPLHIVYVHKVKESINSAEDLLSDFSSNLNQICANDEHLYSLKKNLKLELIKVINAYKNLNIDDYTINHMLSDEVSLYPHMDENLMYAFNYMNLLSYIHQNTNDETLITKEVLFKYYSIITNQKEEEVSYRVHRKASSLFLMPENRKDLIEELMDVFVNTINNDLSTSLQVKIFLIHFYMDYLKPFDKCNEYLSCALIKTLLIKTKQESPFSYLPLEQLWFQDDLYETMVKETMKANDLTYSFNRYQVRFNSIILNTSAQQLIANLSMKEMYNAEEVHKELEKENTNDFDYNDETLHEHSNFNEPLESIEESVEQLVEQNTQIEEHIELTKDEPIISNETSSDTKETIHQDSIDQIHEDKLEPVKIIEVPSNAKKEEVIINKVINTPRSKDIIDTSHLDVGLSDKEALKLQEHLLEKEPFMKKGQAEFFSKHCTYGRYYTIQQYKKKMHCVYETARTSMDNLVNLGYYRKEQVKNKFVYTPAKRVK